MPLNCKSYTQLSAALGVAKPTLYEYKRRGCPIEKGDGGYDVETIRDWIRRNIRQKLGRPTKRETRQKEAENGNGVDLDDDDSEPIDLQKYEELYVKERALKTQAQREREELKHAIESGQYVPLSEVKERDIERIYVFKTGLLALPRRLAQEMVGLNANQMEVMLKTRFRELLERFAAM